MSTDTWICVLPADSHKSLLRKKGYITIQVTVTFT